MRIFNDRMIDRNFSVSKTSKVVVNGLRIVQEITSNESTASSFHFYYGFKERNARRPEESLKLRKKNIVLLICCYETCRN